MNSLFCDLIFNKIEHMHGRVKQKVRGVPSLWATHRPHLSLAYSIPQPRTRAMPFQVMTEIRPWRMP